MVALMLQVWDRRALGSNKRPVGVLVGHTEGITHIDPKGDGRHLISNSKDQSVKLWDLRSMMDPKAFERDMRTARLPKLHW